MGVPKPFGRYTLSSLDPSVIGPAYYKTPLRVDRNGVDSDEVVVCIGADCLWSRAGGLIGEGHTNFSIPRPHAPTRGPVKVSAPGGLTHAFT